MLPALDFDSSLLTLDALSIGNQSDSCDPALSTAITIDNMTKSNPASVRSELRFTRPTPFQESKNFWKRSIAAHHSRTEASVEQHSSSIRGSHPTSSTARAVSIDSSLSMYAPSSDGDNESTVCSERFCTPSAIAVWPHSKQSKQRHSTPTERLAGPRSPRKRSSTQIFGTFDANASPRRAFMPRRVQSRGKLSFLRSSDSESKAPGDPLDIGINEILVKMEVEIYNEMAHPGENPTAERRFSAQSMWNDPLEQHKFTSTWRDLQEGNTTREAFLGKSTLDKSSEIRSTSTQLRTPTKRAFDANAARTAASTSIPVMIKPSSASLPPTPPARRSSRDKGIHDAKSLCITRMRSYNELEGIREDQTLEQEIEEISELVTQPSGQQQTRLVSSMPVPSNSPINLKTARSVESLLHIEAMITPKSAASAKTNVHSRSPKKVVKHRPSKIMQPAGQPPERPLPKLPVENDETRCRCRLSELCQKHTNMTGCNADAFASSPLSISTLEAQSPVTPTDESRLVSPISKKDIRGLSIDISAMPEETPTTPIIKGTDLADFPHDSSPTTRLRIRPKQKKISTNRSEKVRELKKKHMAATSKGRTINSSEGPTSVASTSTENAKHPQRISRCTQTTETLLSSPHFLPPPLPPPFPASSKPHGTLGPPTKTKKDSMDELDQFPRVPLSRPGSRASIAPTIQSTRGTARTSSPTRKSRSRARTMQGRQSLTRDSKHFSRQPLSHSVIHINVDTDPNTCSFRASAISRSPSRSPRGRRSLSPTGAAVESASLNTDIVLSPSPKVNLIKQKQSSRSLRSQASIARTAVRHGLERVSPVSLSRPGSRHNPGLLSSDEDPESADFVPKRISSARPGSKSSNRSRASRKRKERAVPQLPMTGQFAMEHVLMALAKCQNQGLDISLLSPVDVEKLAHQQKMEDELDSRAVKRLSIVQRPPRPVSGRFDEPSRLLKVNMKMQRPKSDISIATVAGTDTDASTHRLSDGYSILDKRYSAGSLTDPTDIEIMDSKAVIQPVQTVGSTQNSRLIRTRRRPSSPTLSMKSFSYYQAQNSLRQPTIVKRASLMLMAPPIAPPRTTSRSQTDPMSSSASTVSKGDSIKHATNYNGVLDLDATATSDPFMLGMLDGMATWTHPIVNDNVWRTWGDQERVIEGKALFTPPRTAMTSVCVP